MSWYKPKHSIPLLLVAAVTGIPLFLILRTHPDLAAAKAEVARRDFAKASEHFDTYLATHPSDAEARFLAAQTARRNGAFEKASAHLWKYRQLSGSNPVIVLESRLLTAQQGDLSEINELLAMYADSKRGDETPLVAEAAAQGVLRILKPIPGPATPLSREATPLIAVGRRAADVWLELRTGRYDRSAGLVWRGRLRIMAGEYTEGLADIREAHFLDPGSFDAQFHLALSIAQSSPLESVEHLLLLRDRRPSDPHVRFGLALTYRMIGRIEEARDVIDGMLASDPNDLSALIERSSLALESAQSDEAERLLLRAYAIAPNVPEVSLLLGRCMQLKGQTDQMKNYLGRFEELEAARKRLPQGIPPKP
jgi:tetratricopeptide (TPR) repeat protein